MRRSRPSRDIAREAALRPARYGRYTWLILWVLQGWMTMFFLGAGYAKVSEPMDLLTMLMAWPGATTLPVVRAVGCAELALAGALLAPMFSAGRVAKALVQASTAVLTANAAIMAAYYAVRLDPGLFLTNAALILLGAGIVFGHGSPILRSGGRERLVRDPS